MSKNRKPPNPPPAPPVQEPPEAPGRTPPGLIERFAEQSFELAKQFLEHHLRISLAAIAAIVFLVAIYELRSAPQCIKVKTEYIGELNTCESSQQVSQDAPIEGLSGNIYTDLNGRFTIKVPDPDQWSIIPAEDDLDDNGRMAKALKIPAGLIADSSQDITIKTDDAAVVFLSQKTPEWNIASLWVFRIPGRTGPIDDLIRNEIGEQGGLRRTGTAVVPFVVGRALSGRPLDRTKGGSPTGRVHPDHLVMAPDHLSALLVWQSPFEGVDMDIVGRFVVGPKDTFYITALTPKPANDAGKAINGQLHTMIQSFRAF
jgi:hypothetical protein